MGNNIHSLKISKTNLVLPDKPLHEQYELVRSLKEQFQGELEIYKNLKNPEQKIFCRIRAETQSDDDTQENLFHSRRSTYDHPNLIQYVGLSQKNNHTLLEFCIEYRRFYQYFDYTLSKQIMNNKRNLTHPQEQYIWLIIRQIVSVLAYLENRNVHHKNICPATIFIDEKRDIKLLDSEAQYLLSNYVQALQYKKYSLLSPEQLLSLNRKEDKVSFNWSKSDMFSLGMTLLEVTTLENSLELYHFEETNNYIQRQKLEDRLKLLKLDGYSDDLVAIIQMMLSDNISNRLTFGQLQESDLIDKFIQKDIKSVQLPPQISPQIRQSQQMSQSFQYMNNSIPKVAIANPVIQQRTLYTPQQMRSSIPIIESPPQQVEPIKRYIYTNYTPYTPERQILQQNQLDWEIGRRVQNVLSQSRQLNQQYGYQG